MVDEDVEEAMRIVPMRLRISGYTWPTAESASTAPLLPIIHVEGESAGLETEPLRIMKGQVSMIGEGAVRWTLVC